MVSALSAHCPTSGFDQRVAHENCDIGGSRCCPNSMATCCGLYNCCDMGFHCCNGGCISNALQCDLSETFNTVNGLIHSTAAAGVGVAVAAIVVPILIVCLCGCCALVVIWQNQNKKRTYLRQMASAPEQPVNVLLTDKAMPVATAQVPVATAQVPVATAQVAVATAEAPMATAVATAVEPPPVGLPVEKEEV